MTTATTSSTATNSNGTGPVASAPGQQNGNLRPKRKPSDIIGPDLRAWGYQFAQNELDGAIYCNGEPFDDGQRATLRMRARDAGYGDRGAASLTALDDYIVAQAHANRFHPVRNYLKSLVWDGDDHIGRLATYITDAHLPMVAPDGSTMTTFHTFWRRWMLNAVAKAFGDINAISGGWMLVINGAQGDGKSHLCRWICPLPDFFIEDPIRTEHPELARRMATIWIWEVAELQATVGLQNVEALKATLTRTQLVFRLPYARENTIRRPLVAWLGTLNPSLSGWLRDQTGNRRFVPISLTSIDWSYARDLDPAQLWAQAVYTWQQDPKSWILTPAEVKRRDALNAGNMQNDPYLDTIAEVCTIDPNDGSLFVETTELRQKLQALGFRDSVDTLHKRIAAAMQQLGTMPDKHPVSRRKGYKGAQLIV